MAGILSRIQNIVPDFKPFRPPPAIKAKAAVMNRRPKPDQDEKIPGRAGSGLQGRIFFLPYADNNSTNDTPEIRAAMRKMLRDPYCKSGWLTQVLGVLSQPFQVHTPKGDKSKEAQKQADFVRDCLEKVDGEIVGLGSAILMNMGSDGFSLSEKVWETVPRGSYAGKMRLRVLKPKGKFETDFTLIGDGYNNVTGVRANAKGITYPISDFVYQRYLHTHDEPHGMAAFRASYGAYWSRDTVRKLRIIHKEKNLDGLLMGTFEDPSDKSPLEEALRAVRESTWITVPAGVRVESISKSQANESDYKSFDESLREEILVGIALAHLHILQGSTTGDGRGDTKVHKAVADLGPWLLTYLVQNAINNQIIPDLIDFNYPMCTDYPRVTLGGVTNDEILQILQVLDGAQRAGFNPSRSYYANELTIQEADPLEPEDKLAPPQQPGMAGVGGMGMPPGGMPGMPGMGGGAPPDPFGAPPEPEFPPPDGGSFGADLGGFESEPAGEPSDPSLDNLAPLTFSERGGTFQTFGWQVGSNGGRFYVRKGGDPRNPNDRLYGEAGAQAAAAELHGPSGGAIRRGANHAFGGEAPVQSRNFAGDPHAGVKAAHFITLPAGPDGAKRQIYAQDRNDGYLELEFDHTPEGGRTNQKKSNESLQGGSIDMLRGIKKLVEHFATEKLPIAYSPADRRRQRIYEGVMLGAGYIPVGTRDTSDEKEMVFWQHGSKVPTEKHQKYIDAYRAAMAKMQIPDRMSEEVSTLDFVSFGETESPFEIFGWDEWTQVDGNKWKSPGGRVLKDQTYQRLKGAQQSSPAAKAPEHEFGRPAPAGVDENKWAALMRAGQDPQQQSKPAAKPAAKAKQHPAATPEQKAGNWTKDSQREYSQHKRALTKVLTKGDPHAVIATAEAALKRFETIGFPDDWSRWERAKENAEQQIVSKPAGYDWAAAASMPKDVPTLQKKLREVLEEMEFKSDNPATMSKLNAKRTMYRDAIEKAGGAAAVHAAYPAPYISPSYYQSPEFKAKVQPATGPGGVTDITPEAYKQFNPGPTKPLRGTEHPLPQNTNPMNVELPKVFNIPKDAKGIEKRLKEIRQAKDMAFDQVIYDKGASLKKLEAEEAALTAEQNKPAEPADPFVFRKTPEAAGVTLPKMLPVTMVKGMKNGRFDAHELLAKAGMYTDTRILLAIPPGKDRDKITELAAKARKDGDMGTSSLLNKYKLFMPKKYADEPAKVQGYAKGDPNSKVDKVLLEDPATGNQMRIESKYYAMIKKHQPDATFHATENADRLVLKSKGKVVGVVVPLVDDAGSMGGKYEVHRELFAGSYLANEFEKFAWSDWKPRGDDMVSPGGRVLSAEVWQRLKNDNDNGAGPGDGEGPTVEQIASGSKPVPNSAPLSERQRQKIHDEAIIDLEEVASSYPNEILFRVKGDPTGGISIRDYIVNEHIKKGWNKSTVGMPLELQTRMHEGLADAMKEPNNPNRIKQGIKNLVKWIGKLGLKAAGMAIKGLLRFAKWSVGKVATAMYNAFIKPPLDKLKQVGRTVPTILKWGAKIAVCAATLAAVAAVPHFLPVVWAVKLAIGIPVSAAVAGVIWNQTPKIGARAGNEIHNAWTGWPKGTPPEAKFDAEPPVDIVSYSPEEIAAINDNRRGDFHRYRELPMMKFADAPTLGHDCNEDIALAGKDGKRAAELMGGALKAGRTVLAQTIEKAVARLLQEKNPLAVTTLFDDEELKEVQDSLSAVNATADLLGRARLRGKAENNKTEKFSDADGEGGMEPDPFVAFAEVPPLQQPNVAADYFRKLVPTIGVDPKRYGPYFDRYAFTLAHATDTVVLRKVQDIIADQLQNGNRPQVVADIADALDAAGLTKKNPQYPDMVYRTNMMDSYNQGQDAEMKDPYMQTEFPVWRYLGIDDNRAGDDHRPKFGRIYPSTATFAEVRGDRVFNCRCGSEPIHRFAWRRMMERGAEVERDW